MSDAAGRRAALLVQARRKAQRERTAKLDAGILAELYDKQVAFVKDPSKKKAVLGTRRAGKTQMWVRYCSMEAMRVPRSLVRIWAITRLRAKQLLWDEFKWFFARQKIHVITNETELSIKFDNGAEIRLVGADKEAEVQKKRGEKTLMEVVLEAQMMGSLLKPICEDVAGPSLFDMDGTICLEGTPGAICSGYWYDVTGAQSEAGWTLHRMTMLENPFVDQWRGKENWRDLAVYALDKVRKDKKWAADNPTFIREYKGQWVNDLSVLYYRFDATRNTFDPKTIQPWGPGWTHVLGWDLGWKDSMALTAWGWHPAYPYLFEAFSWQKPGVLSSEVVEQIQKLEARGFNFAAMVADTGGGGRMYVEEVSARYSYSFEAAQKTDKYAHVNLFNDDLLTGKVKVAEGSELAQCLSQLPRDIDWPPPDKPEAPPREDPRFPNHVSDSGLYAWRRALHFLHAPAKTVPKPGSIDEFEAHLQENAEKDDEPFWERDFGADYVELE